MAKGEKAIFTIHSDYAYGDGGSPPKIPGGATLIFEVELFDFEGEDISPEKDKSLVKRIKVNGEGYDHPNVKFYFNFYIHQLSKSSISNSFRSLSFK